MYITEDFDTNTKHLTKFTDLVEALNHLLQWPNKCNLYWRTANQPKKLLAYKEV